MKHITVTVGLLFRRQIRRFLMEEGFRFEEERGWFDSLFVVFGETDRLKALLTHLRKLQKEDTDPLTN